MHGMESSRNQAQASKSPFPVEFHRAHLLALTSCDDTHEVLPAREINQRFSVQRFGPGKGVLVTHTSSACKVPKF